MTRRPVLGVYVPGDTPMHRLDARVKLVLLLAMTVAAFCATSPSAVAICAGALVVLLLVSRVSFSTVVRGLRPAAVVLAFSFLANAIVVTGGSDVTIVGQVGASAAGALRGTLAVARIAMLVGFALVVSSTTMPTQVADAASSLARPLGRLGVPVGDLAMSASIALRFIPIVSDEYVRIVLAQTARGARFDEGSVRERLAKRVSVLVPLVVALFRRADELALAMGDRCYSGDRRTILVGPMRTADWAVLAGGLALCVLVCLA
jgi:energy-coupling factor transporter transmembrane protein EcfT